MRSTSWRLWVLVAVVAIALLGRAYVFRPMTSYSGAHFNRGANAAWIDITWVMDPHDREEISALADELARREIRYAFAYTSYLKPNGQFNPTYSYVEEFVDALKEARPDIKVLAWIGLPLKSGGWPESGHVELRDAATRNMIAKFSADIVSQGGFDGIHLDPEPIDHGDAGVLALLDEVRQAVGSDAIVSIATPPIQPLFSELPVPLVERLVWRADYYREIARRVDQIAVMTYDSFLPLPELYRLWVRFEVVELSRALEGTGVELLIGIPTSEEETWSHHPTAEKMLTGLQGVIDALNDLAARPKAVAGVAVYPQWETDEAEWAIYESLWLGRSRDPVRRGRLTIMLTLSLEQDALESGDD